MLMKHHGCIVDKDYKMVCFINASQPHIGKFESLLKVKSRHVVHLFTVDSINSVVQVPVTCLATNGICDVLVVSGQREMFSAFNAITSVLNLQAITRSGEQS